MVAIYDADGNYLGDDGNNPPPDQQQQPQDQGQQDSGQQQQDSSSQDSGSSSGSSQDNSQQQQDNGGSQDSGSSQDQGQQQSSPAETSPPDQSPPGEPAPVDQTNYTPQPDGTVSVAPPGQQAPIDQTNYNAPAADAAAQAAALAAATQAAQQQMGIGSFEQQQIGQANARVPFDVGALGNFSPGGPDDPYAAARSLWAQQSGQDPSAFDNLDQGTKDLFQSQANANAGIPFTVPGSDLSGGTAGGSATGPGFSPQQLDAGRRLWAQQHGGDTSGWQNALYNGSYATWVYQAQATPPGGQPGQPKPPTQPGSTGQPGQPGQSGNPNDYVTTTQTTLANGQIVPPGSHVVITPAGTTVTLPTGEVRWHPAGPQNGTSGNTGQNGQNGNSGQGGNKTNFDHAPAGTKLPNGHVVQPGETVIHDGNQIRVYGPNGQLTGRLNATTGQPWSAADEQNAQNGTNGQSGNSGQNGTNGQRQVTGSSATIEPGEVTPFGVAKGKDGIALPLGMGLDWHQLLLNKLKQYVDQTGTAYQIDANGNLVPMTGPDGKPLQTPDAAAKLAETALRTAGVTGTFNGSPTLAAQRQQAELSGQYNGADTEATRQAKFQEGLRSGELTGVYGGNPTENARQFDVRELGLDRGQATLARENQAFQQQSERAKLASNPRNIVEASMFGPMRGGLNGFGPLNQVTPTTSVTGPSGDSTFNVRSLAAPGAAGDTMSAAGAPGTSAFGALDSAGHGLTYSPVKTDQYGIPVTAFARSVLEGTPVPQTGSLNALGGWVNSDALRSAFNPTKLNATAYFAGTPGEQEGLKSLGSYAGFDDKDLEEQMKRALPQESAGPKYGLVEKLSE